MKGAFIGRLPLTAYAGKVGRKSKGSSPLSEASQTVASGSPGFWGAVKPYVEKEPLAALFLGISSGFPFAMIAATLTTRLAQDGVDKKTVTAFTLAFLVYNFKWLWAWIVDGVRLPVIGALGQRVSWLIVSAVLVVAAVVNLALADPRADIIWTAYAAILVGAAGATFDIVIDAYRIELLEPHQLGAGSGMSQYGWRIGSAGAAAVALVVAARYGWSAGYMACAGFALPAVFVGLWLGEPARRVVTIGKRGVSEVFQSVWGPFAEFLQRPGAMIVLLFILVHKIGDTLANLTFRLLFDDLKFTNNEIAFYDVGIGFWAYLIGIFIGGVAYAKLGVKRSVLAALVLMAVSNLSFAGLAAAGHSNIGMAGAIGFENTASGFGGVVLVAYFSALCDLRYTAAQYAMISAAVSIVGRFVTGTTAGAVIENIGYVNFYLLTTVIALPGIVIYWWMMRTGLVDEAMGTAGTVE
jgi:MFS transporter, PAT family, beta-lactamase induction signal transducer AmpG